MKCPNCSHNQRRSSGYVCGGCGRGFVFRDRKMADGRFAALVRKVSGNGTYHYSANQLYAAWCEKQPTGCVPTVGGGVALIVAGAVFGLVPGFPFDTAWLGVLGFMVLLWHVLSPGPKPPDRQLFDSQLEQWRSAMPMPELIREKRLGDPPPEWPEEDIYEYGAEQILIVQDELLVDVLVLNDLHATQRTLVLSASGYPRYVVPLVEAALASQNDVPVFFLHGTAVEASSLKRSVERLGLDISRHVVVDLGWSSDEVESIKVLKACQVRRWQGDVPVDLLHPKTLLGALSASMTHRLPLATPLGGSKGTDHADIELLMTETHFG